MKRESSRWRKVEASLLRKKLDLFLLDDLVTIYYLTNVELSLGRMWIGRESSALFVDGRYLEEASKKSSCPVFASKEEEVVSFFRSLRKEELRVGFDSSNLTVAGYQRLKEFSERMKKEKISLLLEPLDRPFKELRLIKESEEIATLKKAAALSWKGFSHVCSLLKEGVTEEEMAWQYEKFCRERGGTGMAFDPIVSFGVHTSMPHHRPDKTPLKNNEIVMIDVGVILDQYRSDMTRTIFFGTPDPKLSEFYTIVQRAQRKALSFCKPGTKLGYLDEVARGEIERAGYGPLFVHRLGHGVGLEVHEYPSIHKEGEDRDLILEEGMVFTVEPGIYQPGLGGVRYEDTIVITPNGFENFYSAL